MGNKGESYTATLARLDERLANFISNNNEQHKEIIAKIIGNREEIDNLCIHVNDENEKSDKRITKLEDSELTRNVQWKTIVGVAVGSAGLTTLIIQLLEAIHVI